MAEAPGKKKKLVKGRHASQIKRERQSVKRHERNVQIKSALRTAIKKVRSAVEHKNKELAVQALAAASKTIQKAASKGVLHPRNSSRKISRLSSSVHALS